MVSLSAIIRAFDIRHVGSCPTCMRISFLTMFLSWVSVLCALALDLKATTLISAVSILLTLLWLTHVVRYAMRSTHSDQPQNKSRRLAIRLGTAAIGAAAMSVAFPLQARADSACGGWGGGSNCPPCSDYGYGPCMRQNAGCGCYYCRSCGNNCGETVC